MVNVRNLPGSILLALAAGALVVVGLTVYASLPDLLAALSGFHWVVVPLVLACTTFNYLLRFLKFEILTAPLGAGRIPRFERMLIYFSGLSMVVTPGKVGEWVKSYLLREAGGIPLSRSAPVVLVERLTDAAALAVLATFGMIVFRAGWESVLAAVFMLAAVAFGFRSKRVSVLILRVAGRMPFLAKRLSSIDTFFSSGSEVFAPKLLVVSIAISVVAWSGEALGFAFILGGFGMSPTLDLLINAAFVFSVAILAGAVLLVPGGLGVTETGMTGLLQLVLGVAAAPAAAATILTRACTIWYGVLLGSFAMVVLTMLRPALSPFGRTNPAIVPAGAKGR